MYLTTYCPLSQNISTRMNHWCPAWPTQYTNTPDPPAHFHTLHQRWMKLRKSTWTALRAPLLPPHLSIWTCPTRSSSPNSRSSAYRASTPRTAWTTQTTSRTSAPWSSKHTPTATCRLRKMQNTWGWKCTSTLWRQVTVKMSHFTVDTDGRTSIYSRYAGKHFAELSDRYACRQGQNELFITWATFQICLFCFWARLGRIEQLWLSPNVTSDYEWQQDMNPTSMPGETCWCAEMAYHETSLSTHM